MTEGEKTRLIAWSHELRRVHARLREALEVTREAAYAADDPAGARAVTRELLLFCHGFCVALTGHHTGEDQQLFPAIAAEHPQLADTLRYLQQDHTMIEHLIGALRQAAERDVSTEELVRHLDGLGAIMESHVRYEERELLAVLESLALDADPDDVLGPL